MSKSIDEELEDIFNIKKDGSNIVDEEGDDDNGYAFANSNTGMTFDQKAAELAGKVAAAEPTKELPRTPVVAEAPKPEAPKPEVVAAPVAEQPKPAKQPKQRPTSELEGSLVAAIASTPVTIAQPEGVVDFDSIDAAPESVAVVIEAAQKKPDSPLVAELKEQFAAEMKEASHTPKSKTFDDFLATTTVVPTVEEAPREFNVEIKTVYEKPVVEDEKISPEPVKSKTKNADTKVVASESKADEEPEKHVNDDVDHGLSTEDADGWALTAPTPQNDWFYATKRKHLPKMLVGGKLPFNRFDREMGEFFVDMPDSEFNPNEILEKMREVQNFKNRVEKIRLDCLDQYFLWKRYMDVFRGLAGKAEGAKGAAIDAASAKHLMDFEFYWGRLQSVTDKTEGIRKNLDSAYENLSRQVSLCMPNQAMERIERPYEPQKVQSNQKSSSSSYQKPKTDLSGYDSLDVPAKFTPSAAAKKPAKAGGEDWGDI